MCDAWVDSSITWYHVGGSTKNKILRFQGPEITRTWLAYSLYSAAVFGEMPFKALYSTPLVVDPTGKKISKSGKYRVDLDKLFLNHSVDTIITWAAAHQGISKLPIILENFKAHHTFQTKIVNFYKIAYSNSNFSDILKLSDLADCWIWARTREILKKFENAKNGGYGYVNMLIKFVRLHLSKKYLAIEKNAQRRAQVLKLICEKLRPVMYTILPSLTAQLCEKYNLTLKNFSWGDIKFEYQDIPKDIIEILLKKKDFSNSAIKKYDLKHYSRYAKIL